MEILSINRKIMMREITVEDVRSFLNSMNVKLDIYGLGLPDRQTICVSFHKADFTIQYPFK